MLFILEKYFPQKVEIYTVFSSGLCKEICVQMLQMYANYIVEMSK
jgi:hypothetical protein